MRSAVIALAAAGVAFAQDGYIVGQISVSLAISTLSRNIANNDPGRSDPVRATNDNAVVVHMLTLRRAPTAPVYSSTPVEATTAPVAYTSEAPTAPVYSAPSSSAPSAPAYSSSESVASPVESTPVATSPAAYTTPVVPIINSTSTPVAPAYTSAPVAPVNSTVPYPMGGNSTTLATSGSTVTSTAGASSSTEGSPVSPTTSAVESSPNAASSLRVSAGLIAAFGALFAFLA